MAETDVPEQFDQYEVCFEGCTDTLEDVFGTDKLTVGEMTGKLWNYIKKNDLIIVLESS